MPVRSEISETWLVDIGTPVEGVGRCSRDRLAGSRPAAAGRHKRNRPRRSQQEDRDHDGETLAQSECQRIRLEARRLTRKSASLLGRCRRCRAALRQCAAERMREAGRVSEERSIAHRGVVTARTPTSGRLIAAGRIPHLGTAAVPGRRHATLRV